MFTGFAIRTTSCQTTVSVIYIFPYVPDSLLLEHLKLSCGIHNFSLNLNIDFSKLLRHNPIPNRVTRSYFISVYGDSSFRSVLSCSKLHISFFLGKLSTKF